MNYDGRGVDTGLLDRMAEVLRHRGPDGSGRHVCGGVGLAHTRLAIIDLKTGDQPMRSGELSVVYNGEIYNYVELRDRLRRGGRSFRTTSDTEVLLELYADCGEQCVAQLHGMFAFLLHDPARGRLIAARDHFGIKPLYYHVADGEILFASEIKAILQHPGVRASVDLDALRDYLTFQYVLDDRTLFHGVRKVRPGEYLDIDTASGRIRHVQYWEPKFGFDRNHTEQYFVEEVRRLLEEAVTWHLRSDVPVGTFLSGGLDSSLITSLAARRSPIVSFSGVFGGGPTFDESAYAREVACSLDVRLHEVEPTEDEFTTLLPQLIHYLDEPAAGPGVFPQFVVSRLASEHVKVVLGGQGGDEIFGGYARYLVAYFEQAIKGAIYETNEEREHIVSLASILPNLPFLREYVPMLQQLWERGLFEPMDRRYFRLIDRSGGSNDLLSPEFRTAYDHEATFARFQAIFNHPDTPSYYNKMTHFDLLSSLPALLHVEDRVTMANSLESRVPLLDRRLAELVAVIPPRMKFRGGELKYLLKKAVHDVVPATVLARKDKMGFPVPLHLWVRGRSRDFVRDILLSSAARTRGILDPAAVERALDTEPPFSRRIWGLLCLELWHREFIDGTG